MIFFPKNTWLYCLILNRSFVMIVNKKKYLIKILMAYIRQLIFYTNPTEVFKRAFD